jgi:hypothetical protein
MHPHIPRPRRKATRTCTDTAGVVRTVHGGFMWPFTARVNEKTAPIERIAAVAICRRCRRRPSGIRSASCGRSADRTVARLAQTPPTVLRQPTTGGTRHENADKPRSLSLLRVRNARAGGCDAANQRDELAPLHSITSSARANKVAGTSTPRERAVCILRMNSNFVDCKTGRSAGLVPLRMLPL